MKASLLTIFLCIVIMNTHAQEFFKDTNGKWGLVNKTGNIICPAKYDEISVFYEGMARVKLSNKYGFVDIEGKEIIAPKYQVASHFFDGMSIVNIGGERVIVSPLNYFASGGKWGYINKSGKKVIPIEYESAMPFSDGLAVVSKEIKNKYGHKNILFGYINKEGQEVIALKYQAAQPFSEGLALVELGDKKAFINKSGKVMFYEKPGIYVDGPLSGGYIPFYTIEDYIKHEKKRGYLDSNGAIAFPPVLQIASPFVNGVATIMDKLGNKWEVDTVFNIKGTNKSIYPGEWVKGNNGKFGLMRRNKQLVLPVYDEATRAEDGYSSVRKGTKLGVVDNEGQEIVPLKYDKIFYGSDEQKTLLQEGYFVVERDNKMGYVDLKGNEIAVSFYKVRPFNKGLAEVLRTQDVETWGYIDKSGKSVDLSKGDLVKSFDTPVGKLEVYKSVYKDAFNGVGLRQGNKVLIFPYYESITYNNGIIRFGENREVIVSTLAKPSPVYIEINEKEKLRCTECGGEGYSLTSNSKSGGTRAVTEYKTTTSYERKWNPSTNSYDGYKVEKSTPVTRYEKTPDSVTETRNSCPKCHGRGTLTGEDNIHLKWDSFNYAYKVD